MVLFVSSNGQNLVPNYSFEDTLMCVSHGGQFNGYLADWVGQGGGGGLWYFTAQCPGDNSNLTSGVGVPYNYASGPLGFQYAHSGVSYAGIWTFATGSTTDTIYPYGKTTYANARDYIQAKLIDSLKPGVIYYITFFVSLANYCDYSCSDIGAFLSNTAPLLNNTSVGLVLKYAPQIANNSKKEELSDTLNWQKISGSFKATGGEQYITIGNFKNDSTSSIRYLGQISQYQTEAYYYIDDVIVSPDSNYADSLAAVGELKIKNEELKIYPNPSNGKFAIEIRNYESGITNVLEVYNMFGENIYNTQFNTSTTQIDLSGRPTGVYMFRVVNENGKAVGSGKLMISQ